MRKLIFQIVFSTTMSEEEAKQPGGRWKHVKLVSHDATEEIQVEAGGKGYGVP